MRSLYLLRPHGTAGIEGEQLVCSMWVRPAMRRWCRI
jgi:hypothetical protein